MRGVVGVLVGLREDVVAVLGEFLGGEAEVFLGDVAQPCLQFLVGVRKGHSGERLVTGIQKIVERIVLHPDRCDVVECPDDSVLPDQKPHTASPETIAEAATKDERQPPARLLKHPCRQNRVAVFQR